MTSTSWELSIKMLSDWCIGSGYGESGSWDRSIARDADGLPYLPAKELKGLWRDACERVAWGFDNGQSGEWSRLAERLFGSGSQSGQLPEAARSMLWVSDARLPEGWIHYLRAAGDEVSLIRNGLTRSRFGVAIDGSTGTARDDMLREIEVARAGLRLEATCRLPKSPPWQAELLLLAGAKTIDHLGGKRRRGLGRCQVSTSNPSLNDLLNRFEKDADGWQADSVLPATSLQPLDLQMQDSQVPGARRWRRRASVRCKLRQPVLAARSVLGNTVLGYDFVPGSTLLPLVLGACDGAEPLVREGRLIVTNANPCYGDFRAVPTPNGLVSADKGSAWRAARTAVNSFADDADLTDAGLKPVGGWVVRSSQEKGWLHLEVPIAAHGHASIDDEKQSVGDESFFVYSAINAGTEICFEVWDDGSLDGRWHPDRLEGRCSIGRSRASGYGEVDIYVEEESGSESARSTEVDSFVLTLESDTCIMGEHGPTPTAEALAGWLSGELGVKFEVEQSRISVRRRDSWYGAMGAPKASVIAIAAGSQVKLNLIEGQLIETRLQALIDSGLGVLCTEGYGRARFDPSTDQEADQSLRPAPARGQQSYGSAVSPDDEIWQIIHRQVWIEEIYRRVSELPSTARAEVISPTVSRSQLGSLREASNRGAPAVRRWVASTEGRQGTLRGWGAARLALIKGWTDDGRQLVDWLNEKSRWAALIPRDLGDDTRHEVLAIVLGELARRQSVASAAASSGLEGSDRGKTT